MELAFIAAAFSAACSVLRRVKGSSDSGAVRDAEACLSHAAGFDSQIEAMTERASDRPAWNHRGEEILAWREATQRVLCAMPRDMRESAAYWMIAEVDARNQLERMSAKSAPSGCWKSDRLQRRLSDLDGICPSDDGSAGAVAWWMANGKRPLRSGA